MSRVRILTITIKIAIIVLLVRELWLLLNIPSITNGIVNFFTIGLIPGTNTTLTSTQTYALAAAVLLLAICVIFRRELNRVGTRQPVVETPITIEPVVVAELPAPKPHRLQLVVYAIDGYIGRFATLIAKYIPVLTGFIVEMSKTVIAISVDFWHQIEPDLWKADAWLEAQFHKFKPTARLLGVTNELLSFVTRQIEKYLRTQSKEVQKDDHQSRTNS